MPETRLDLGEFKFLVPVAKAVEEGGELYVEGVASSTTQDAESDIISAKGQASMAQWANTGAVVLGGEADHFRVGFDDDLGVLEKGEVQDGCNFYIRARLDKDNPRAVYLHKKMSDPDGPKLGLSVFGVATEHHRGESGQRVIDGVVLKRVMVTSRPVNPDTWLMAVSKSLPVEPDPLELAKGAFLDALRRADEVKAEQAPVKEQRDRLENLGRLYHILYQALDNVEWANSLSAAQRAVLMDEAIEEFKREVLAKSEPASETVTRPDPVPAVPEPEAHPAVRIAKTFQEAASLLFAEEADPATQRAAMQQLVTDTAQALDKALPVTDGQTPAWAQALLAKVESLEARLAKAAVPAATGNSETGNVDTPVDVDKLRKSAPAAIHPSANVAKAQSFYQIVDQLFAAGAYPEI